MNRKTALCSRQHQVSQSNIREGAAHHDFVITPSCAIGVEVLWNDAVRLKILPGRAIRLNRACRGDVIRRYRIAQHSENTGPADVRKRRRLSGHIVEEWRTLN